MNTVTQGQVIDTIAKEEYTTFETLTICVLTLKNGYKVTGESACVAKDLFNEALGQELAKKKAIDKIWMLEGYALAERLKDGGDATT